MANDTTSSPIRIDTYGSNVTISTGAVRVTDIIITVFTSQKTCTFINNNGDAVLTVEAVHNSVPTRHIHFGPDGVLFSNGLYFDESASDLASGDFIYIWTR